MGTFIGTKTLMAIPMTRGHYNTYRGWEMPSNEDADEQGYLVEYLDGGESNHPNHKGYISWSPKEVFEKSYQQSGELSFGHALIAIEQGKRVARAGWNGKGMFIFQRPADELEVGFIIDKVKSLPQSVKDFFQEKDSKQHGSEQGLTKVKFSSYLCMYAADGSIINGWLASQTDMLAKDWSILD